MRDKEMRVLVLHILLAGKKVVRKEITDKEKEIRGKGQGNRGSLIFSEVSGFW